MKRQFLLIGLLLLSALGTWAERIDVAKARQVAESVASRSGGLRSTDDLSLVYAAAPGSDALALRSGSVEGAADYFVFNVPGERGFVIVSGDDRAYPVLGYSDKGSFDPDNLPENLRAMLAFYQEQIGWAERNDLNPSQEITSRWVMYAGGADCVPPRGKTSC